MKLFISGKGKFTANKLTPTMERMKKSLDASKNGELFTTRMLAKILNVNISTLQKDPNGTLLGYSALVATTRYWGKPATIRQLIKESR